MLIGIMSDTHGDHLAARRAVELFDQYEVKHIIHCGDVCGTNVLDELVGHPVSFVWGNMDEPNGAMYAYLRSVGLDAPAEVPLRLILDGTRFAVFHGHEGGFENAITTLDVDYILHGHTHVARDETVGSKRIINPGALYRAKTKSVATLDTSSNELIFLEIAGI